MVVSPPASYILWQLGTTFLSSHCVFLKPQPQRNSLEEHAELVLDSERLKGLEGCQGKLYFPSLPMFWEHLSNRVSTSSFQERDSGSCFTAVVVEVYACREPSVCACVRARLCVFIA